MINVFNKLETRATIEGIVLEKGHNFISSNDYATLSKNAEFQNMCNTCKMLVGDYEQYVIYETCVNDGLVSAQSVEEDDFSRLKKLQKLEEKLLKISLLESDFVGDTELTKKTEIIRAKYTELKEACAKIDVDKALKTYAKANETSEEELAQMKESLTTKKTKNEALKANILDLM